MKKFLLLSITGLTIIALTATTLFAQTIAVTSMIDKMKEISHAFILAGRLNPGETNLTSEPVKGKKTGDILTAGEWNRVLELIEQIGSSDAYTGELWKCSCGANVNMVTTTNLGTGIACISGGTSPNIQYATWACTILDNSHTPTTEIVLPPAPTGQTYNCPAGFVEFSTSSLQRSCIEKNATTSGAEKTFREAKQLCIAKGADLCTLREWSAACDNKVITTLPNKLEWIEKPWSAVDKRLLGNASPGGPKEYPFLNPYGDTGACAYALLRDSATNINFSHRDIEFRCCADRVLLPK